MYLQHLPGVKTHNGDCITIPPPQSPSPSKSVTPSNTSPKASSTNIAIPKLSTDKLMGKECLLCEQKRTPKVSGIPFLHIGQYRKFQICKKGHLTDEEDSSKILAFLNDELAILKDCGDTKSSVLADGSSDEETPDNSGNCAGFHKPEDTESCNEKADGLLWVETAKESKIFCKPTHMLRYIGKYHLGQGKKAHTENSKKRKTDKNEEKSATDSSGSPKTSRKSK
jgi:hypothetical protein